MNGIFIIGEYLETYVKRGDHVKTKGEDSHLQGTEGGKLDLKFLASGTVRKYLSYQKFSTHSIT